MKILIICRSNQGRISPFISDQVESIINLDKGCSFDYYLIESKGILGYLKSFIPLLKKIRKFNPDIVHAHYGLSGLLAVMQRKVPVVITFHGSDINNKNVRYFSRIAAYLSRANIFVSEALSIQMPISNYKIIPCGVNMKIFKPMEKEKMRKKWNLDLNKKYILFSSHFTNQVKNASLAKKAINSIDNVELLELKGYSREEVAELMNASDVCLLTSFSEGSPQFIKEAMACNRPIVTTDVGDVHEVIGKTEGCYITSFELEEATDKTKQALQFGKRTTGREDIKHLDSNIIAEKIIMLYEEVLKHSHH